MWFWFVCGFGSFFKSWVILNSTQFLLLDFIDNIKERNRESRHSRNCFLRICVQAGWLRQTLHPAIEKEASSWLREQAPLPVAFFLCWHHLQLLCAWNQQPRGCDVALQKDDWNFTVLSLQGQTLAPIHGGNSYCQPHTRLAWSAAQDLL